MSPRRRLALVVCALPVAFYAYACSSSDSGGGSPDDDAGGGNEGGPRVDGSMMGSDSSSNMDSSMMGMDAADAADASDGAMGIVCIGNPLFPDGGTPDGGANVDAGVLQIVSQPGNNVFLDGPQWVSAGAGGGGGGFLVYSEFTPTPQVHKVLPDGGANTIFRSTGLGVSVGPIGNAVRGDFVLTTGSATTGAGTSVILRTAFDGGPGSSLPLPATPNDGGVLSPNDLVVGKNGSIYITDPRYQTNPSGLDPKGIFQTGPDAGGVKLLESFNGDEPNGIGLSPDGAKLYVSFTVPKRIDTYPVNAVTGVVTATATPFVTGANLIDSPDGIAVDVGGNIWVSEANVNPGVNSGRIEVFKPDGKRWGQIAFPTQRPTGVAFGGPGNKTVFITVQEGVYAYTGRCAGLPSN